MIKHTFLHIPGIGKLTEQRFWESGTHHWDHFARNDSMRIAPAKKDAITACLDESQRNLESGNPNYFSERLPANQHWRFFPEFRGSIAYLDIETTGLDSWNSEITTIALYDGNSTHHYVNGQNLDDFVNDITKYKVLVTYNGKTFDVPFIERYFGISLHHAHIDLRYILSSLGYKGGLKYCEIQLGMDRGDLSDIDGYFAVLLWDEYRKKGNRKALETLLAYNIQDVLNLEALMVTAYNLKIKETPFYADQLPESEINENPFAADMRVVDRIKGEARFAHGNFW